MGSNEVWVPIPWSECDIIFEVVSVVDGMQRVESAWLSIHRARYSTELAAARHSKVRLLKKGRSKDKVKYGDRRKTQCLELWHEGVKVVG